jgi:hypothetical protein
VTKFIAVLVEREVRAKAQSTVAHAAWHRLRHQQAIIAAAVVDC